MAKMKVTLTLDADRLAELRAVVGARNLSKAVDSAVEAYLGRLRHLTAVDEWLVELEYDHGPVAPEAKDWAAGLVDRWETARAARGQ
jgi:hypothetical protein